MINNYAQSSIINTDLLHEKAYNERNIDLTMNNDRMMPSLQTKQMRKLITKEHQNDQPTARPAPVALHEYSRAVG